MKGDKIQKHIKLSDEIHNIDYSTNQILVKIFPPKNLQKCPITFQWHSRAGGGQQTESVHLGSLSIDHCRPQGMI